MTLAGIPTEHRGANFRSRLEARWATFFDLIGWRWTYEPIDADGYIPDFVIHGKQPFFVEVGPCLTDADYSAKSEKPFKAFPADSWTCNRERRHIELGQACDCDSFASAPSQIVLVAGVSPVHEFGDLGTPGLLNDDGDGGGQTWAHWGRCPDCTEPIDLSYRIFVNWDSRSHLCRAWPCGHTPTSYGLIDPRCLEELWNIAGSQVQWKPR